jgi:hypothetical protein
MTSCSKPEGRSAESPVSEALAKDTSPLDLLVLELHNNLFNNKLYHFQKRVT